MLTTVRQKTDVNIIVFIFFSTYHQESFLCFFEVARPSLCLSVIKVKVVLIGEVRLYRIQI